MRKTNKKLNYISLFSGAGVGCFAFKKMNFDCIATCELLKKRLEFQKINEKCKFESGYICGDINDSAIEEKIFQEIKKWNCQNGVDIIIATPPCQGMSVANQKKTSVEINRNSLVLKAIELVKKISPKIFIFENVPTFLKTKAVDKSGKIKKISEFIEENLESSYLYISNVYNFKNYGSNSSRTRTLVIGVKRDFLNTITPFEVLPHFTIEKSLRDVIGKFKPINKMGDIDPNDVLHNFKSYDKRMLEWIKNLSEGESAFDNLDDLQKPHRVINGKIHLHKKGFGDKYKRQIWDKVAPCIHTANDCLASQNTIHPQENRVFSISELMAMMSIPRDFKWTLLDINSLPFEQKIKWLKENEGNIRKCIGESVPTGVFERVAKNIVSILETKKDLYSASYQFEKNNTRRTEDAAFYTTKLNLSYMYDLLPEFKKSEINILEPAVGMGSFLTMLIKKYQNIESVNIDVCDINKDSMKTLKNYLKKISVPANIKLKFICADFVRYEFGKKYDLVIGNPPFKKTKNQDSSSINLFELFWLKSLQLSKIVIFINPKYFLSSNIYKKTRNLLLKNNITNIIDFGELGFKDVKIETIVIKINNNTDQNYVNVVSLPKRIIMKQQKNYIFCNTLPYWIIYRNDEFDKVYNKMHMDIFNIYKNYEISNKNMLSNPNKNTFWIIRSKNIDTNRLDFVHIKKYDRFADKSIVKSTNFYKHIISIKSKLYLIPTLTYYPRIIEKKDNSFVNGSVLVAELKDPNLVLKKKDLLYYYSEEFRRFYLVAFNHSTRTLNIDSNTIKFFGILR